MELLKKFISEMLGTFILVLIGCGTAVTTQANSINITGCVATACAFGFGFIVASAITNRISGTNINPAVSIAMCLDKRISFLEMIIYIAGQIFGATAGAFLIKWFISSSDTFAYCLNTMYQQDFIKTTLLELTFTTIFVLTVLFVTNNDNANKQFSSIYIGCALIGIHLFGMYFDGVSLNPARTLGVAFAYGSYAYDDMPSILLGSILGGILAWIIYTVLSYQPQENNIIQPVPHKDNEIMSTKVQRDKPKRESKLKNALSDMLFEDVDDEYDNELTVHINSYQMPDNKLIDRSKQLPVHVNKTTSQIEKDNMQFPRPTKTDMSLPHCTTSNENTMTLPN